MFVADTNHHRIVVADPESGEVLDVAGSGAPGFADGAFAAASFDGPQGMALSADGGTLYVADTGNHAVRALDLGARTVATLAGTGEQAANYPPLPGAFPGVALSSPWDLARDGSRLYVAMAGSHQIWVIDLERGVAEPAAGSGREGVADGDAEEAELAQPSGLVLDGLGRLYWADAESSTIRYLETGEGGGTGLLAGSGDGLFDFGDVDGVGREARFQHPLGVAFDGARLFVADTYNDKIKQIDPATGAVTTFAGGRPAGPTAPRRDSTNRAGCTSPAGSCTWRTPTTTPCASWTRPLALPGPWCCSASSGSPIRPAAPGSPPFGSTRWWWLRGPAPWPWR